MLAAGRNHTGLTTQQIEYCLEAWTILCADLPVELDVSEAMRNLSRTRFNEEQNKVLRVPPAGMLDVLHKRFLQQLLNWPHEGEALRELFPGRLRFSISDRIPASLRDTATCSRL